MKKNNPDHNTILDIASNFTHDAETERLKNVLLEAVYCGDYALDKFATMLNTKYWNGEIAFKIDRYWL